MRNKIAKKTAFTYLNFRCEECSLFESFYNKQVAKQIRNIRLMQIKKAGNETRTHDPFITSEVLYRLSYSSLWNDKCIKIYTLIRHKRYFKL